MVKFGADEILRMDDSQGLTDESIDELLRKGEEKTEETNARIQKDMQVCWFFFSFFVGVSVFLVFGLCLGVSLLRKGNKTKQNNARIQKAGSKRHSGLSFLLLLVGLFLSLCLLLALV